MNIAHENDNNLKTSRIFRYLKSFFEPNDLKISKSLLKTHLNSPFKGFKQVLLTIYLFYAEILISLVILVSFIDQISIISLSDEMIIEIGYNTEIDIIFSLEIIINILFSCDFIIKLILHEYFMDKSLYGFEYLICDCMAGIIPLIYDIFHMLFHRKYTFLGFLLRSFKIFTLEKIRKILHKLRVIYPKISPLIWGLLVFFYFFSYFAEALYYDELPIYFGTISDSLFTMFQILTLDNWGVLGRLILEERGVFQAYYIAFYIFLMTYFFLNILLGFLVDHMTPFENHEISRNIIENAYFALKKDEQNAETICQKISNGPLIDGVLVIIFLMSGLEIHNFIKFNDNIANLAIIYEFTIDFLYTLNFMLWIVFADNRKKSKVYIVFIIIIKFMSGPLAFLLDFSYYFVGFPLFIGHYFRITQIFSTKTLSNFIFMYFPIFTKIGYPFLTLIGLITVLACWTTERLNTSMPEFFGNLNLSIYSFIQMLSLDEWCNTMTRGILLDAIELALVFVLFIFVANYILLNVMLAIACSEMKQNLNSTEETHIDEHNNTNQQTYIIKSSLSKILDNLMSLIAFHHKFLYKKIMKNYQMEEFKLKKIQIYEKQEIDNFYNLKEILKNEENQEFSLEFKGKKISCQKIKNFIILNKNLEIFSYEKIKHPLNKTIFYEFSEKTSYFEIQTTVAKTKDNSYKSYIFQFFRLGWSSLSNLFKKSEEPENFHSLQ